MSSIIANRHPLSAALALCALSVLAEGAAQGEQRIQAGELDIHYSVLRAHAIRDFPQASAEHLMHGGVPRGTAHHHVMVALYDAGTRQRVDDAIVTARVAELAMAGREKPLEVMVMGGTVTYGNYFKLSGRGPYRITLKIVRPDKPGVISTSFDYTSAPR